MHRRNRPIRQFNLHNNRSHRGFLANVVAAAFTTLHSLYSSRKRPVHVGHIADGSARSTVIISEPDGGCCTRYENVIVYIDNLLVHSATHKAHIKLLDKLVTHNVKINLQKCFFGSRNVAYLGFRLTKEGVKPGTDKLKAVSFFLGFTFSTSSARQQLTRHFFF